jgi:hypothetical protein
MSTIHIDRKKGVRITEIQVLPLEKLKLDPQNVRFRHVGEALKDRDMEKQILDEPETRHLLNAIIASGGLSTRPIVTDRGVVKEGNRRIVCLRRIAHLIENGELPELNRQSFASVECEVLPRGITEREVDIYLGRVHVSGVKEWDAINQAQHIWTLYHERDLSIDEIRDFLGLGKGTIIQKLRALEWTTEFMRLHPRQADIKKFSFFEELYKKKSLRAWIEEDSGNLRTFFTWVAEGRFDNTGAKDVRQLPEVMEHAEAWKTFKSPNGNFSKALRKLQEGRPELSSPTFEAVKTATEALTSIGLDEYRDIPNDRARVQMLQELYNKVGDILADFDGLRSVKRMRKSG